MRTIITSKCLLVCGLVGFILYYSAHFYLLKHTLRLHSVAARWVVSYILVTMFVDVAMVSYYDLMTHYFLVICFIVIYQENAKRTMLKNKKTIS